MKHLKPLMFVGTCSDAGKSIINTAFCRILKQDGYLPAPFKAQNMSLNSYASPEGLELGRAQAVQAEACRERRFEARLAALRARGIDTATLAFEASHGRTTLEYYDGFVFSFQGLDAEMPPVASGGRYDALTAVLGQGRSIPAVGGVIRPAMVAELREGAK